MKFAILSLILIIPSLATAGDQEDFQKLNKSPTWKNEFHDSGSGDWHDKWFLDGEIATVRNSAKGMHFSAGPEDRNDAHHAVLWTQDTFSGDLKVEFTYTRTDRQTRNVNILYLQATGTGEAPYLTDISKWSALRKVPTMSTYYNHMNALHLSFAAFPNQKGAKPIDYLRVRRYPLLPGKKFDTTKVPPSYEKSGLFLTGETYVITVIKTNRDYYFQAKGKNVTRLYHWDLTKTKTLAEGRIGLRHMYTRSSIYKDFKVSTRPAK